MSGESQIVSELSQLKDIEKELKRLYGITRELKKKKETIEQRVLTYLNKIKRDGVKTQDIMVLSKEKVSRPSKPREEKEKDVQEILQRMGIRNTEQAYKEITDAMKGEERKKQALVLKQSKK
jgi:hypothetical protein